MLVTDLVQADAQPGTLDKLLISAARLLVSSL
jgi:hypothetical protein